MEDRFQFSEAKESHFNKKLQDNNSIIYEESTQVYHNGLGMSGENSMINDKKDFRDIQEEVKQID